MREVPFPDPISIASLEKQLDNKQQLLEQRSEETHHNLAEMAQKLDNMNQQLVQNANGKYTELEDARLLTVTAPRQSVEKIEIEKYRVQAEERLAEHAQAKADWEHRLHEAAIDIRVYVCICERY